MRLQHRNKRTIYYANYLGNREKTRVDQNGVTVRTGEIVPYYSEPMRLRLNKSPARGETSDRNFGESEPYDKVIVMAGRPPFEETAVLWLDNLKDDKVPLNNGEVIPHDYMITKIAESLNSTAIAVTKVNRT